MTEADFLAALRALPLHPGALGLADDAARLGRYVLTTDTVVEGVHFLASDPAGDVAWKLLAVNLSDLAAKGAVPEGVLLSYPLRDAAWDADFIAGLGAALAAFGCALLGGDTVALPPGAPRVLTMTAIGEAIDPPPRSGARAGDALYITGTIGDAGAGLAIAQGADGPAELLAAYRRPVPLLAQGRALAPVAQAMMDVSDGLLIDAARMALASGLALTIDLACRYRRRIADLLGRTGRRDCGRLRRAMTINCCSPPRPNASCPLPRRGSAPLPPAAASPLSMAAMPSRYRPGWGMNTAADGACACWCPLYTSPLQK